MFELFKENIEETMQKLKELVWPGIDKDDIDPLEAPSDIVKALEKHIEIIRLRDETVEKLLQQNKQMRVALKDAETTFDTLSKAWHDRDLEQQLKDCAKQANICADAREAHGAASPLCGTDSETDLVSVEEAARRLGVAPNPWSGEGIQRALAFWQQAAAEAAVETRGHEARLRLMEDRIIKLSRALDTVTARLADHVGS